MIKKEEEDYKELINILNWIILNSKDDDNERKSGGRQNFPSFYVVWLIWPENELIHIDSINEIEQRTAQTGLGMNWRSEIGHTKAI